MQNLRGAGCDLVVMGTIIRETIGTIGTARKLGWNVELAGSSTAYDDNIHKLGGPAMNGFYSVCVTRPARRRDGERAPQAWIDAAQESLQRRPDGVVAAGYTIFDVFVHAAQKAGPNLTSDTLNAALEGLTVPRDSSARRSTRFPRRTTWATSAARSPRSRTAAG